MEFTVQIIQIIFQSVAILFMICFMFIGIWSFIVFLKIAKNQRIQTYLLEKINKSISSLENRLKDDCASNHNSTNNNLLVDSDNIIKFDDNIK